ncbi:MAG: ABC-F type ribosomal protection protein [Lachnospiraceae bacterium]|nr:ABC-F type ribosomal protection protein [Lachnospiraceae bacterium]
MIVSVNQISKSFGDVCILNDVSFHINEQEKAAVVGVNGAGKSTLLKIMTGELSADAGQVVYAKGASVGYLEQHQTLSGKGSVYDEILSMKKDILQMEERLRALEIAMSQAEGEELAALGAEYSRLSHRFTLENGFAYRSQVTGILKGLGFAEEDFDRPMSVLSGGQKTRVALAKLLVSEPDLLLLDEPTNHLDMSSIAWLETFLLNYKGAVLVVSHDRYFMNRIVTKVVEISHTHARMYLGNYDEFSEKKALLRESQRKQYLNQQQEIAHQKEVIEKLRSFNREKSIKRAESREKLLEKIELVEKPEDLDPSMRLTLSPSVPSGNDVLTITNLSKSFGSHTLFSDLNVTIHRGEHVAVIGDNGTGKTTLLKILRGLLPADSGSVREGAKVTIGYYDQEQQNFHPEKTVFDELHDEYPLLDNTKIRSTLAAFLFTGEDVFKQVKDLSGGERGRLSLAKLILSPTNFLLLDEPTNHLDIQSKEILEEALAAYTGTLLYVSHDRYFVNRTATRILELTGQRFLNYEGNYDDYLEKRELIHKLNFGESAAPTTAKKTDTESKQDWQTQKEEQARLRRQQNQIAKLEAQIAECEASIARIDEQMQQPETCTDSAALSRLSAEKEALEETLMNAMEEWDKLSS